MFVGKIIRCIYKSKENDFKIYAVDVNKEKYPEIKNTKYGSVSIMGNIHDLSINQEYTIYAKPKWNDNRSEWNYEIDNIQMISPKRFENMYEFLSEILTEKQAKTLYSAYPNIVDLVIKDKTEEVDLSQLKGIKEKTFQKIIDKIKDNFCLADLVKEFYGVFSFNIIKKLYNRYTSVYMVKKKLRENPYECLCGLSQVGFILADQMLLDLEKKISQDKESRKDVANYFPYDLSESKERCLACILYLLNDNEKNGHTKINLLTLNAQCKKLVPKCAHHFVEAIKDEQIFYNKEELFVCKRKTFKKEVYVADKILKALYLMDNVEIDVDKERYYKVDNLDLSKEQKNVLNNICDYNVSILNGYAGSGKSFSTKAIINMCKENEIPFLLLAPTGRASKVLAEYANETAATIHRGLGFIPGDGWGYNDENQLPYKIIVVDEVSMCDLDVFYHLLCAINFNTTKLLIVGDNAQLPSVGCGNILHDLINSELIPMTTLTKIFRYSEGGLMKVASDVRESITYLPQNSNKKIISFGENKDYTFVNVSDDYIVKNMIALYRKMLDKGFTPEDIQVITSYRKGDYGSVELNNKLQKIANKNYGKTCSVKSGDTVFYEGDLIIQTKNNYHAKLDIEINKEEKQVETFIANGENGIIVSISNHFIVVNFDGINVRYLPSDFVNVDLGYCITSHKSQGGSIKIPIILTPSAHTYMLSSNILYVDLTRTKVMSFHLGNIFTVNECIKRKDNISRNTTLPWVFKNIFNSMKSLPNYRQGGLTN